ncbi:MAG: flagellar export chaperone FliS [Syntrophomonadaceae bacterium]|jgi:flagellar protein FliS|nr:flagellar export chaperone FliS [Syntrophomonadaceae bacterium]
MSVNARAYQQYRNSVVETASPGRLLLMLYNAAIRNLDAAHRAIEDQNTVQANDCLLKAQDILLELMSTLDMEYEIAKQLLSLYDYMYRQLIQANVKKDVELVDEVRGFLVELRDTWQEAIKRNVSTSTSNADKTQRVCVKG